jgi:hypothetical protein
MSKAPATTQNMATLTLSPAPFTFLGVHRLWDYELKKTPSCTRHLQSNFPPPLTLSRAEHQGSKASLKDFHALRHPPEVGQVQRCDCKRQRLVNQ